MAQPTANAQLLASLLDQLNGTSAMAAASLNLSPQQLQMLTNVDPNVVARLLTASDPSRARYLAHALGFSLENPVDSLQHDTAASASLQVSKCWFVSGHRTHVTLSVVDFSL
jgi:ABC-type phosphonate transport system ATPase subunit